MILRPSSSARLGYEETFLDGVVGSGAGGIARRAVSRPPSYDESLVCWYPYLAIEFDDAAFDAMDVRLGYRRFDSGAVAAAASAGMKLIGLDEDGRRCDAIRLARRVPLHDARGALRVRLGRGTVRHRA
jgi:hypothetical protein